MTLEQYLSLTGIKQKEFAEKARLSQSTVSRLIRGKFSPSRDLLSRIYEATGGDVQPNDFYKQLYRVPSVDEAAE